MALTAPPASAEPLRIGVSLPLSGDISVLSRQFLEGARLALAELAAEGDVEIMEVDDGCDPDLAELAAEDMRAARVSIAIGYLCNSAAVEAARELKDSGIPILVAGARADFVLEDAEENGWNVWRMAPGEDYGAQAAFERLSQRWQTRPWAVIDDGTIYGRTLSDGLRVRMEEAGQAPQMVETIRPGSTSMTRLVRRMREAGIAAVFVAASLQDTVAVWREAGESDVTMEVAGGEALQQLPWMEEAESIRDGLLAVKPPAPDDLPAYANMSAQMISAGIAPEPYVFLGYAAMETAMAALRDTPAATAEALDDTVFRTVLGMVKFDETGRNVVNRYRLYQWQDGRFLPIPEVSEE